MADDQPCPRYCGDRPGLCEIVWRIWPDDSDAVAIVIRAENGIGGWCWINLAHANNRVRPLVRAWAAAAIYNGVSFDALHLSDLMALVGPVLV